MADSRTSSLVLKKLRVSIVIQARRETVWELMLAPDTYRVWTSAFAEGSYFEGSWAEGERIRFLVPDGNGMASIVAESRPPGFLSLKHLGVIKDGVEDTTSEAVTSWAPSFENYILLEAGAATELEVEMDVMPEIEGFMEQAWPKALASLKALCEARDGAIP